MNKEGHSRLSTDTDSKVAVFLQNCWQFSSVHTPLLVGGDGLLGGETLVTSVHALDSAFCPQGWGPRGLSSTSRTARGQKCAALALALASKPTGLGLGLEPHFSHRTIVDALQRRQLLLVLVSQSEVPH